MIIWRRSATDPVRRDRGRPQTPAPESHLAYIDSTGLHEIPTEADGHFAHAVWAPRDSIIFDSMRDGARHIFRMGIDGRDVVDLTPGDAS